MTVTLKNDPNDKSLFSNEGVKELIPPPAFDYRTYELDLGEVEDVIERVTHHLVHLKASDPRFTYTCASCLRPTIQLIACTFGFELTT